MPLTEAELIRFIRPMSESAAMAMAAILAKRDQMRAVVEAAKAKLDADEAEATAILAAQNAEANFSSPDKELDTMSDAMVRASNATQSLRAALHQLENLK